MKTDTPEIITQAFNDYSDKIRTMLFFKIGNHEDAEDISQRTWEKVCKNIDSFNGDSALYTWIYQIAVHELYNHIKSAKTKQANNELHIEVDIADECGSLEDNFGAIELREEIENKIKNMPDDFKQPLCLREFGCYSYEQIAQILCIPIGTVRSRIKRGRDFLFGVNRNE